MPVRFGAFEVDLASGELRKQGLRIRLQEQPFAVLTALLERPGDVVSREDLIRSLWPDGTVVDFDRGLNAAVTRLRQALSDSAETPRYIETVARRGYRFIGTIDAPAPVEVRPATPSPKRRRQWAVAAAMSALVLAGAGYFLISQRSSPVDRPWKLMPLTTEPGHELNVSFSPDGSQVTFQWEKGDGRPHIVVKLVGSGDPIRLTSAVAAEYGPAWSPDGRLIAFLRDLSDQTAGIFVIPPLGGVERKVAEIPAPPYWALRNPLRRLDWTPDSRHLVVSGPDLPNAPERLFLISVENGEKRWLTSASDAAGDREPAVSPDGRTVAFVRGLLTTSESILLLPLRPDLSPAGDPKPLTPGRNPVWTPDGREIVFKLFRVYTSGLAEVGVAAGDRPRELPQFGNDSLLPAISRTGRLAYSQGNVDINVWRQEIPETAPVPAPVLLISSTARDSEAQYSPDGARIAFQSNRSGHAEIWTCGGDGLHCGQLTAFNGGFITGSPRWSPDGKTIAFDSAAEGRFNVYTVDAAGGPVRRLTSNPAGGAIASWSRDGKWIYYFSLVTGREEIWKIPSDGGSAVQVTRNGGLVAFEALDGTALYYTKTENEATLWKCALDGSAETRVVEGVANRGFALTKDGVFYLRGEPEGAAIRRLRFATGEDTRLAQLAKRPYLGLSLSPDGRYLLYSQFDQQGTDLVLVERFR